MPTKNLHKAAGQFARHAAPMTRSLALVAASMLLTACGDGALFPAGSGGSSNTPNTPTSSDTPTNPTNPTSPATPTTPPDTATGNYGPSISGKPQATATVNQPYSFKPEAYDPDGDVLTFQVSELPSWATFSPATGEIAGVPPKGWAGKFADIRISVTDGRIKTALPVFSITVADSPATSSPTDKSVTLSWTIPTQNDDGTPLTNLAGYRIYYGEASSNLNQRMEIANPATASTEIPSLTPGTWYFAMTSVSAAGIESSRTGTVSSML